MTTFEGQTALVTGAGSGIGRATAMALARRQAHLCLAGRTLEKLKAAAQEARRFSESVTCCPTDLTSDDEIERLAEHVREKQGAVDLLIHSAGTMDVGALASTEMAAFERQMQTNARGPLKLTTTLLPDLKAQRGQVVFVNSSVTPGASVGSYAASKYALRALTDALRDEVNDDGVRVLSVYPGRTATPMQKRLHAVEGKPYDPERLIQPGDVADLIVHTLGMPRSAEVTDIHVRPMQKP